MNTVWGAREGNNWSAVDAAFLADARSEVLVPTEGGLCGRRQRLIPPTRDWPGNQAAAGSLIGGTLEVYSTMKSTNVRILSGMYLRLTYTTYNVACR